MSVVVLLVAGGAVAAVVVALVGGPDRIAVTEGYTPPHPPRTRAADEHRPSGPPLISRPGRLPHSRRTSGAPTP
ncbi:MAG: hypothetical protein WKF96_25010 [Solirubrobacteraceae bacterium]